MMATKDDRVKMFNPNTGRQDGTIARDMFEPVRNAILRALQELESVPFSELSTEVERRTPAEMWEESSLGWYTTTVKLHLEATGMLERHGSPQQLTLTDEGRAAL